MGRLGERGAWLLGAAIVLAVIAVASIDRNRAENKIPPIPPPCMPDTIECNDARNAKFGPRLEEMRRLDHDFDGRAWIYAIVATAAMVGAAIVAVGRHGSSEEQRREFSHVGVVGVTLGLAAVAIYVMTGREIKPPAEALFLPCLALVVLAAVGGSVTRLGAAGREAPRPEGEKAPAAERQEDRAEPGRFGRQIVIAALGCSALTVLLAWVYAGQQSGSCDVPNNPPAWTTPVAWAAVIAACAAGLCAYGCLAVGRWFVALICFVVSPAALIYMLLSTGVAC
jgi:peptidoglycan/LPS O-acetylase OafA/YrhL